MRAPPPRWVFCSQERRCWRCPLCHGIALPGGPVGMCHPEHLGSWQGHSPAQPLSEPEVQGGGWFIQGSPGEGGLIRDKESITRALPGTLSHWVCEHPGDDAAAPARGLRAGKGPSPGSPAPPSPAFPCRKLRWHSFQNSHRPSLNSASLEINRQSSAQLNLLQKCSLLRLTAIMEKYSVPHKQAWTW